MSGKYCPSCGDFLPVSRFYSNVSREDGLSQDCRECTQLYQKQLRVRNGVTTQQKKRLEVAKYYDKAKANVEEQLLANRNARILKLREDIRHRMRERKRKAVYGDS